MDYASFSPADMRLNNSVFQWHFRMPEVFEEHKKIINANRLQYENSLKVSWHFSIRNALQINSCVFVICQSHNRGLMVWKLEQLIFCVIWKLFQMKVAFVKVRIMQFRLNFQIEILFSNL